MEKVYLPVVFQGAAYHLMFVPSYKSRESLHSDHFHFYSNDPETKSRLPVSSFSTDYIWESKEWTDDNKVSSEFIAAVIDSLKHLHYDRYDRPWQWTDHIDRRNDN